MGKMRKSTVKVEINEHDVHREKVTGLTMTAGSYIVKLSDDIVAKMKERMEKLRDERKDWHGYMYLQLSKRMKLRKSDQTSLDIDELKTDETIVAFGIKLVENIGFDVTPKQKTIKEAIEES